MRTGRSALELRLSSMGCQSPRGAARKVYADVSASGSATPAKQRLCRWRRLFVLVRATGAGAESYRTEHRLGGLSGLAVGAAVGITHDVILRKPKRNKEWDAPHLHASGTSEIDHGRPASFGAC